MKNFKQITVFALIIVSLFTFVACESANSNDPNSPSNVTKRFVKAAQTRNVAEYKASLSKKTLAGMEKDAKETGMNVDKMVAALLEQDLFGKAKPDAAIETRSENITGDKASVQFKDGKGEWMENALVKEDGNWKVSMD